MPPNRTALIVGATGLVGRHCLQLLLAEPRYDRVVALTRKPLNVKNAKLIQHQIDFDHLDQQAENIRGDDIYCTLGTTIRHAGSKENFRKVDFKYPLETAETASQNGAQRMIVVTAIGANPESRVFYLRVKGELEEALSKLPFKAVHFMRPAWLVGERDQRRLREKFGIVFAQSLSPLFVGKWKNYRSTAADVVAKAMLIAAFTDKTGVQVYKTTDIWKLASSDREI